MANVQTHFPTYDLPPRAHPLSPVRRSDVNSPREQAIQVAAVVFAWIVLPGVFWGALALWLL